MISNEDFNFVSKFDNASTDQRQQLLQEMTGKMQVSLVSSILHRFQV